jgi:FKBP-type peptidyl-prolyl cis-trans isomerase FkpA
VIKEAGDGVKPTSSSIVTVAYKGYHTDGEVFDESSASGITFPLQNVIKDGLKNSLFKEGGSGTLLIPSHQGMEVMIAMGLQVAPCSF